MKQAASRALLVDCFFFELLFDLDGRGDVFFRNIDFISSAYMAFYLR
jgi:hypothetical protein